MEVERGLETYAVKSDVEAVSAPSLQRQVEAQLAHQPPGYGAGRDQHIVHGQGCCSRADGLDRVAIDIERLDRLADHDGGPGLPQAASKSARYCHGIDRAIACQQDTARGQSDRRREALTSSGSRRRAAANPSAWRPPNSASVSSTSWLVAHTVTMPLVVSSNPAAR